MTEAEVIETGGKASELSRHFGLDVNMKDSSLAVSTVASRDYQKQCSLLYREFIKNMNVHLKEEKNVKDSLTKLRQEKINNMKYSLYRTSGEDVFSSAKQKRREVLDNMAIVSPLIFDDTHLNPWGLDPIIDEDLLRPQTAPAHKVTGDEENIQSFPDGERPQTVSNSNYKTMDFLEDITMDMGTYPRETEADFRNGDNFSLTINAAQNVDDPSPSPTKHNEHVRFMTPNQQDDAKSESDHETDGVVDPKTERTRARRITINARAFAKLGSGEIKAKLKNKDGDFKIKPIDMNYTPNEVDAVFIAKDPTKEKMALVRQATSCQSSTVASDLKVNNRIAIMKSLMGIKVKKTTVSEIFENARDRKTRHFRIVLKNPKVTTFLPDQPTEPNKEQQDNVVPISVSITPIDVKKPNLKQTTGMPEYSANQRSTPVLMRENMNSRQSRLPNVSASNEDVAVFHRGGSFGSRKGYDHAYGRSDSRLSVNSSHFQDPLQRSLNGKNIHIGGRFYSDSTHLPDSRSQTPLNRSTSVMSGRESVIFQGTDADMTEMIQRLVEGRGESRQGNNRPLSRTSVTTSRAGSRFGKRMQTPSRKLFTPSSMKSDSISELSFGMDRPKLLNKNTTKQMVKDLIRKDKEYQDSMDTMRRRMGVGGARRSSIVGKKMKVI